MSQSIQQHDDQSENTVMRLSGDIAHSVRSLLSRYGLELHLVEPGTEIPGSYWGDEEAGLIANRVYAQEETPVHSVLHESCHYVCMDELRRAALETNAGGDYDEENAVCYLQILLADELDSMDRARMQADMDRWGYTFRLGSAGAWFESDAEDARQWLLEMNIIDRFERPTFRIRGVDNEQ